MTGRTVLVVEDEDDIRDSLQDALRDEGYTVAGAANGRQALELLPTLARPCAIVLDIIMPVMSGRDFYQAMRADARFADIPVLVSTSDPARAPDGLATLRKPIDLTRLIAVVRALFDEAGPAGTPKASADGGPSNPAGYRPTVIRRSSRGGSSRVTSLYSTTEAPPWSCRPIGPRVSRPGSMSL
jgi:CheY-like chemotaxis protein